MQEFVFVSRDQYLRMPLKKRFDRTLELSEAEEERAESLRRKFVCFDIHTHITNYNWEQGWERERIRNSGVTCFFEALEPNEGHNPGSLNEVGKVFAFVRKQPDMTVAFCYDDVIRAKEQGKQAVMCSFEPMPSASFNLWASRTIGSRILADDRLELIEVAHGLGVRMMMLTYD